jgi:purine-binding chemotaxis protein CheW
MDLAIAPSDAIELISFAVAGRGLCIDIGDVREIRGWSPVTAVPGAPEFVMGVINLRGAVMPVLDLRARLGLGDTEPSGRHVIIVVQQGHTVFGLLVDAVQETVVVRRAELQPPPNFGVSGPAYIESLIPRGDGILGRLNLAALTPREAVLAA